MMRNHCCVAALLLILVACVDGEDPRPTVVAQKSQSPIQLWIVEHQAQSATDDLVLVIHTRIRAHTAALELTIALPADGQLLEGDLHWTGALEPNQQKTLRIVCRLSPTANGVITAIAVVKSGDMGQFAASARYQLKPTNPSKLTGGVKRSLRHGQSIIEYPLKPVE